jgi:hypothetical protein
MDIGLIVGFAGILVAGLAGVLGVWMERDREAPPRWAFVFSGLIAFAVLVEMGHAVAQASEDAETAEAMAEVLDQLAELADKGDNPALEQFVGAELAAASRNNPRMMKRLEGRMKARGKDPSQLRRRASEGRRRSAGLPDKKRSRKAGEGRGDKAREGGGDKARTREGADAERGAKAREGGDGERGAKAREGGEGERSKAREGGADGERAAEREGRPAEAKGKAGQGARERTR